MNYIYTISNAYCVITASPLSFVEAKALVSLIRQFLAKLAKVDKPLYFAIYYSLPSVREGFI